MTIKDEIKECEMILKSLERKKKKTVGIGFAKIKIREKIAELKQEEVNNEDKKD